MAAHTGRGAQPTFLRKHKKVTVRQWFCTPCFGSDEGYVSQKGVFKSLETHPDMEAFSSMYQVGQHSPQKQAPAVSSMAASHTGVVPHS